jgi:Uma2 family endonuclease
MTESDATREYLIYAVEVLRLHFESRRQVYVSGNLFIYYEEGNPKAVVSPDVFVVFGVSPRFRRSYKTWQEMEKHLHLCWKLRPTPPKLKMSRKSHSFINSWG